MSQLPCERRGGVVTEKKEEEPFPVLEVVSKSVFLFTVAWTYECRV